MSFWSSPQTRELKQKFRWYIKMGPTSDNTEWRLYAKSVELPSYEIKVTTAKMAYSHEFKFPNRITWNPISISFYDFYDSDKTNLSTTKLLHDKLHMEGKVNDPINGYILPWENGGANVVSRYHFKDSMISQIDELKIVQIGTDGSDKDTWILKNPFIMAANYDKLDYSEEAGQLVTIKVSYDWAQLNK